MGVQKWHRDGGTGMGAKGWGVGWGLGWGFGEWRYRNGDWGGGRDGKAGMGAQRWGYGDGGKEVEAGMRAQG